MHHHMRLVLKILETLSLIKNSQWESLKIRKKLNMIHLRKAKAGFFLEVEDDDTGCKQDPMAITNEELTDLYNLLHKMFYVKASLKCKPKRK